MRIFSMDCVTFLNVLGTFFLLCQAARAAFRLATSTRSRIAPILDIRIECMYRQIVDIC